MAEKKATRPSSASRTERPGGEKRTYFKQADFPQTTLRQTQKIASAIVDNSAGREGSPPDIALGIVRSAGRTRPVTSSARTPSGAAS
jgi:hypothetical protein